MREIRTSGSEGGGTDINRSSLPLSRERLLGVQVMVCRYTDLHRASPIGETHPNGKSRILWKKGETNDPRPFPPRWTHASS